MSITEFISVFSPLFHMLLGPFIIGFSAYAGVKLASKLFGPIALIKSSPKD